MKLRTDRAGRECGKVPRPFERALPALFHCSHVPCLL
jgi:hypothetical protein